jgi:hypothetical protein
LDKRQKPAKNRSTKVPRSRAAAAMDQTSSGPITPIRGPAHTTTRGRGLWARSVREMVSGCRTTRATVPPVSHAPRTWPDLHPEPGAQHRRGDEDDLVQPIHSTTPRAAPRPSCFSSGPRRD